MGKFNHYLFTFIHGTVVGLSILFLIITIGSGIKSCRVINPQKIYTVVDVTDSSGKTYRNLYELTKNTFMDYHGNSYTFNGNFTAITRKISGEQFLKEVQQPETHNKPFPIESIY
jgi:hypothetical protein